MLMFFNIQKTKTTATKQNCLFTMTTTIATVNRNSLTIESNIIQAEFCRIDFLGIFLSGVSQSK